MLWDLALMSVVPMVFVLIINKLQWGPVKKYFRTVNMALVPWCVVMPHYLWTKWLPYKFLCHWIKNCCGIFDFWIFGLCSKKKFLKVKVAGCGHSKYGLGRSFLLFYETALKQ